MSETPIAVGSLVQHSKRWMEQFGVSDALGIVVGFQSSYEGEDWPVVHWEGKPEAEPIYPRHIVPRGGITPVPGEPPSEEFRIEQIGMGYARMTVTLHGPQIPPMWAVGAEAMKRYQKWALMTAAGFLFKSHPQIAQTLVERVERMPADVEPS